MFEQPLKMNFLPSITSFSLPEWEMSLTNVSVIFILISLTLAAAIVIIFELKDNHFKVSTMANAAPDSVEENKQKPRLQADYSDKDFLTDEECDTETEGRENPENDSKMGQCLATKRPHQAHYISSGSSDEEAGKSSKKKKHLQSAKNGPAKSEKEEPKSHTNQQNHQKRYKQTTLNFGQKQTASNAKSKSTEPSRPETRQRRPDGRPNLYKRRSDMDTEKYRLGYPGQKDDPELNSNLQFYKGEITSCPDGAYIEQIHEEWWGNYELLERHHGYIQWLFPIREDGMNWQAQALQLHEAKAIIEDEEAHARVKESYKLMLDFYGMELDNEKTGDLIRSPRWRDRFDNLNRSSHNYLRITRILKSLGEFDLEHLKKPFLMFILQQIFEKGQLLRTLNSLENYWIGTLKNDADREELYKLVERNRERM